jgi:8-oxo-dGTP pyrophosphatase MutT (NUDIX family)
MRVSRVVPHKDLSAGVVAVHDDGAMYRLLVLSSFDQWDFPKAPVVADADPMQTALRELGDATGIVDPVLHWGEDYRETVAFEDGRVSRYYLVQASDNEVALRVPAGAAAEDYGYRWITVEEAEDLLPPRLAVILDWVVTRLAGGPLKS